MDYSKAYKELREAFDHLHVEKALKFAAENQGSFIIRALQNTMQCIMVSLIYISQLIVPLLIK